MNYQVKAELALRVLKGFTKTNCNSEECCLFFGRFIEICADDPETFGAAGACELIARLLVSIETHSSYSSRIRIAALRIISTLCSRDRIGTAVFYPDNIHRFISGNTCSVIVGILLYRENDLKVIDATCRAIRSMLHNRTVKSRFSSLGMCEAVLRVLSMTLHQSLRNSLRRRRRTVQSLCMTIADLCTDCIHNQTLLGHIRGCEVMVSALRQYRHDSEVCVSVCCALCSLAMDNTDNLTALWDLHTVTHLISILRRLSRNDENLVEAVCRTLLEVHYCGQSDRERLLALGAIDNNYNVLTKGLTYEDLDRMWDFHSMIQEAHKCRSVESSEGAFVGISDGIIDSPHCSLFSLCLPILPALIYSCFKMKRYVVPVSRQTVM
eukprot:gene413-748_t